MNLRGLADEDVANYYKTSMFLIFPNCSFKCEKECGQKVCQNSSLAQAPIIRITPEEICKRYVNNPLTSAIVCGGLEPFDAKVDLIAFIDCLRKKYLCNDDIVIFTGYTEEELEDNNNSTINFIYTSLKEYSNIIIKYGRYVPNQEPHYDEILGIMLASNNQYAKRLDNEN